uniref:Reverse transcriptase Ty1/copia-type domain-containing protein n=1 Tax=Tanacetum cinerariifolium TaxID=118510 RepID=A0A6L2LM42_TANCI|nr:hypothetical protein [Tanacetum cinerariifolium]
MEETVFVTFNEDDEVISQSSTEGDAINFNENRSFPDDEFLKPRSKVNQFPVNIKYFPYIPTYENITPTYSPILQDSVSPEEPLKFTSTYNHPALNELDLSKSNDILKPVEIQHTIMNGPISDVQPSPTLLPSTKGKPLAGITNKSKVRDSEAALAYECMNKVWTLVPKPHGKTIIGTKWIWKNRMDENGVVINNKARLEGIDYEETFAPVSRLEAIKNFLAYAAYMGFIVYQMDVKSAFLNGKISKKVYVQKQPGFESIKFPNHVCKLDKALYMLKQALIACVSVNETLFRGMIWSLMYLTTGRPDIQFSTCLYARPDIQFSTCLYARYQANPKESYLVAVKRNFRYLKGTPNLGLWYPKGLDFDLKAYYESDYARCNLDKKSTLGGCQILGGKDHILKGDIELHFVPIDLQLANIFTKPLAEPSFTRLVTELAEVDFTTKSITFILSHFNKPLLFDLDVFSTIIGLKCSDNFVSIPPKETTKAGLATLGLFDEKHPNLSSTELINLSLVKIKYFSPKWKVLMRYIVKCLGGKQGSHDQLNVNQQTIIYCLCWGLEIDIAEILFSDLIASLHPTTGKPERKANILYTRYMSLIREHLLKDAYKNDDLMSLKHHHITTTTFKPTLENEIALTAHMCKVAEISLDPIKSLLPSSEEVNYDNSAEKSSSMTSMQLVIQPKAPIDLKPKKKRIPPSSKPKSSNQFRDVLPTKQSMPDDDLVSLSGFEAADSDDVLNLIIKTIYLKSALLKP